MIQNFDDNLIYSGNYYSVYWHGKGFNRIEGYENSRGEANQAIQKLSYLAGRLADHGQIFDKTKFRLEDKKHKIYVFKTKNERFLCFFKQGNAVIVTSGYRKSKSKIDKQELEKAIKIRDQYFCQN